jgi:hypothetical protein
MGPEAAKQAPTIAATASPAGIAALLINYKTVTTV